MKLFLNMKLRLNKIRIIFVLSCCFFLLLVSCSEKIKAFGGDIHIKARCPLVHLSPFCIVDHGGYSAIGLFVVQSL